MLGTNPIKTSGIHQKFYDEVAERVAALAQALKAVPDQAVADAAVQLLLEERPRGKDLTCLPKSPKPPVRYLDMYYGILIMYVYNMFCTLDLYSIRFYLLYI